MLLLIKSYPDIGVITTFIDWSRLMILMKVSVTSQQKERLLLIKNKTGLSYAEIIRRAFDEYKHYRSPQCMKPFEHHQSI